MTIAFAQKTPNFDAIPLELRQIPQWVCWRFENQDGTGTKLPINAQPGRFASSTEPATWCSFEAAVNVSRRDGYDGIAFVISDSDPYCGVDMDDCLDETGQWLWGEDMVRWLATYAEVSPSGRGIKLLVRGKKPPHSRCVRRGMGPDGDGAIEIYDHARVFAITGAILPDVPANVAERQAELDDLCRYLWPAPPAGNLLPILSRSEPVDPARIEKRAIAYLDALPPAIKGQHGHNATYAAATSLLHGFGLQPERALVLLRQHYNLRCQPPWSDKELIHKINDAASQPHDRPYGWLRDADRLELPVTLAALSLPPPIDAQLPEPLSARILIQKYPELRPPVIEGLLRRGESMNIIAAPKTGKSWLAIDLALAVATGRPWLDTFETERGDALILDNELHSDTSANRLPKVARARGLSVDDYGDCLFLENLRGRRQDIFWVESYLQKIKRRFRLVILDAFYRFLPPEADENSNAHVSAMYNRIDGLANELGCSFVSSKGNQSGKTVTDVGASAGSQSRATDTHLVLRPHEEPDCVVLDAAVRSWPPIEPRVLRWSFPVWTPETSLDPAALPPERPRRTNKQSVAESAPKPSQPDWDAARFRDAFTSDEPQSMQVILSTAATAGLSDRRARKLLQEAEARGYVHRWTYGSNRPVEFVTRSRDESNTSQSA